MSILFTIISETNPVKPGDAEALLKPLGLTVDPAEVQDFHTLLAAVHDCAEGYPRENVRRPSEKEQVLGQAWAHRFLIRVNPQGGPLAGKSISLKDVIAVGGVPQLLGSDIIPSWTPTTDATVVTRLLDAGADIHGTSTCENLCHSTSSYTSAQGTVENPHAPGCSAGGSTSGGAALVAAGVGIKPTYGRVPFTGFASGDGMNDHAGPLTRTTLEAAICLDVISGYDGIDDRALDGFKVGILAEGLNHSAVNPHVKDAVFAAAQKFNDLGATFEEVSLPEHLQGPAIWTIQQRIAGAQTLLGQNTGRRGLYMTGMECARLPWTDDGFQRAFPSTKNVIINGLYLMEHFPDLYGKTANIGRLLSEKSEALFEKYDILIMPTTPVVAPRHGKRELPLDSPKPSVGLTIKTAIFNVTGHPALSILVGFAPAREDGQVMLPFGMQIVGGLWQEEKILRAGHIWETHFDWKKMHYSTDRN
ncbi:Amidase [Penicillium italicum]|uniref:Amidase n=1 Tax=Penicillium italicum TaxID=40296 RepID=A0A0A2L6N2_PENIT|nr:Amidase [Penicillium italicum]